MANGKIIIISVACVVSMLTCCSTQKAKTNEDSNITEQMVGAYTHYRAVTSDEKTLFKNTYNGDLKLTPVKVATQVVAGTNYSFICKDNKNNTYEVVIFEPLPGQGQQAGEQSKPEVTSITKK